MLGAAVIIAAVSGALAALRGWLEKRAWARAALYQLTPPAESTSEPSAWITFYRTLFGISAPWWKRVLFGQPWLSFEFWSHDGRVSAYCWLPERLLTVVLTHLRMAVPGIELIRCPDVDSSLAQPAARARLHFWREDLHALALSGGDPLRSVLGALSIAEACVMQLVIRPEVHWQGRAQKRWTALTGKPQARGLFVSLLAELAGIFVGQRLSRASASALSSWQEAAPDKARAPGFRAELRLRVSAATAPEAKQGMHALTSSFRGLDGGNGLRPRRVFRGQRFDRAVIRRDPPSDQGPVLIAEELAGLFHLPCVGVAMDAAATRVAPAVGLARTGKTLGYADALSNLPMTISQADCRRHVHVLGPTGTGKSTLLLNLALEDIQAGRGCAVIDPKGDLIRALLERVPSSEIRRLVLIDPTFREQPVGLNVLECPEPDERELVSDAIVTIFKKTYERFWGPRTDDILRAAILTLLRRSDTTLCDVPILLLDPVFRQKLTAGLNDPVGLTPFWDEYDRMAEGQRLSLTGPVLNKLRTFLLRPTMRNILGQSTSTIQIPALLDGNAILLVSLAKGLLGEETSRLLGSFIVARLWQAAMKRADRAEEARPDFTLYLDEFQNYLYLPQSLDEVLAEARGYHLSLVVANQHLAQLSPSTREALAANARTRVVFQCGQDDARYLAREFGPAFTERSLQNMGRHQVAIRLCVDGHTIAPFTAVTPAPPSGLGEAHAADVARASLQRYGRSRADVEAAIVRRFRTLGARNSALELSEKRN